MTPTTDPRCLSCQAETVWKATGVWPSPQARNHWSLFGCTCDPAAAADAAAWLDTVTR